MSRFPSGLLRPVVSAACLSALSAAAHANGTLVAPPGSGAGGAVAVVETPGATQSAIVPLTIDLAAIFKLGAAAKTIVIGNPAIADATLIDGQTLVLTGKMAGDTNLLAFDEAARPIADLLLRVHSDWSEIVQVRRGTVGQTFFCAPRCEPVLFVGDDADYFAAIQAQIQARQGAAAPR